MKNPLESLFSKGKAKDAIRDKMTVALAAMAITSSANAEEVHKQPVQDPGSIKAESIQKETVTETNINDTINFADYEAENALAAKIDSLQKEIKERTNEISNLNAYLKGAQSDFQINYRKALQFKEGESGKSKLLGFETKLADLAMKMGQEKVAKFDITSEEAVNGLLGILMSGSKNAPLEKESTYLAWFMQGQLGPTVATNGEVNHQLRGYKSPDMQLHEQLGNIPRIIVETVLNIVKEQYELENVQLKLDTLLESKGSASNSEINTKN